MYIKLHVKILLNTLNDLENIHIKYCFDPYNNNNKLVPLGYNLYKYKCVIFLKEILNNTSKYLEDDVRMTSIVDW
jgi:hypothetical protein